MMQTLNKIPVNELSETEKIIADYFKKNLNTICTTSLEEICSEIYVSNASIIRFCQKLGFNGFNEFKFALKNSKIHSEYDEYKTIIPHYISVLKDSIDSFDETSIMTICSLIQNSSSLYIYGRDFSSMPAQYLYSILCTMDIQCIFIEWIDFLESLSKNMSENTSLILFVSHAENNVYKNIVKNCRANHVKIIWISSAHLDSEFVDENDIYICTNEEKDLNVNTKIISMLIVQLIIENLINYK